MTERAERATAAIALGWGVTALAICGAMSSLEPSLLEEGYIVHFAQRMRDGERLYRDLVTFTGPLPFEALALLFRIFGDEIAVARASVALLQGAACAATWDLARRGGAGSFAHVAAAAVAAGPVLGFPLLSIYFYSTLSALGCLLAAWAAERGIASPRFALVAGLLTAAVALSKQTTGAVLAVGLGVALLVAAPAEARWRTLSRFALGGASATGATLLLFALRGDLAVLWRSLVTLPLSLDPSFTSPFPNLWPPGAFDAQVLANQPYYMPHVHHLLGGAAGPLSGAAVLGIQLLYALPLVALAATAVRLATRQSSPAALCGGAALLALAIGLFPRTDWGHLVFVLPMSCVQLCLLARARGPRGRWASGIAWVAVTGLAVSVLWIGSALHRLAGPATFGPRVPQRPVSAIYRGPGLPRVIDYLRAKLSPGDPIFVARMEPLVYFATEASNPTPFGGVIPGIREEQERAITEALHDVRYVVMSDLDRPVFAWYRDELPAVQDHLERHFRLPPEFAGARATWISVLEPGPDRGPTAIDLFREAPSADRWWRDRAGRESRPDAQPPRLGTRQNRRPLPVWLGPGGGGIDFAITLPAGARLQADVGMRRLEAEAGAVGQPNGVRLAVLVARDGEPWQELDAIDVDYGALSSARWTPFEVDLSAFAGMPVRLRLEARPPPSLRGMALAWWGSPRIITR